MGAPKATTCRHCGLGGELYRGAHVACKNEHNRKRAAEARGPNHCRRCWVVIEAGIEPRRIPPVGAAGWSVSDARRFG